jgi:hypothetical protein
LRRSFIEGCDPTYFPVGLSKLDGIFGENDIAVGVCTVEG